MPDTKLDLEALKALEAKATGDKWKYVPKHEDRDPDAHVRVDQDPEDDDGDEIVTDWCVNLELIAAMRNALPELIRLAEVGSQLPVQPAEKWDVAYLIEKATGVDNAPEYESMGSTVKMVAETAVRLHNAAIKPSAQVHAEFEAWHDNLYPAPVYSREIDEVQGFLRLEEEWHYMRNSRLKSWNAAIASRGQGGKTYEDGIKEAAEAAESRVSRLTAALQEIAEAGAFYDARIARMALAVPASTVKEGKQ